LKEVKPKSMKSELINSLELTNRLGGNDPTVVCPADGDYRVTFCKYNAKNDVFKTKVKEAGAVEVKIPGYCGECRSDREIDPAIKMLLLESCEVPSYVLDGYDNAFYDLLTVDMVNRKLLTYPVSFSEVSLARQSEQGYVLEASASFLLRGNLLSDSFPLPDGTTVTAYSVNGYNAEAIVDPMSGDFRLFLTDMPPGRLPILFIASSPTSSPNPSPSSDVTKIPCVMYAINNNLCSSSLALTLSWDGPDSDVDLHVYENNGIGQHVFYGNGVGDYGSLDIDITDGYGPEHYVANVDDNTIVFNTQVNMYNYYDITPTVNWQLDAVKDGALAWTETGSFSSGGEEWSPTFSISVDPSSCGGCLLNSNSGLPVSSDGCCPPERNRRSFWCLFGQCEVNPTYTLWEAMNVINDPTIGQTKGFARLVFGDGLGIDATNSFNQALANLKESEACLTNSWEYLLAVLCTAKALNGALNGILEGSNVLGLIEMLGSPVEKSWDVVVSESVAGTVGPDILVGATDNLRSYTADPAIVTEFNSLTSVYCV
jgi:hypothetical protein